MEIAKQSNRKIYNTTHLGIAAALCALGYHLKLVGKNKNKRTEFCFDYDPKIDDLVKKYNNNEELRADAKTYWEAYKNLSKKIH